MHPTSLWSTVAKICGDSRGGNGYDRLGDLTGRDQVDGRRFMSYHQSSLPRSRSEGPGLRTETVNPKNTEVESRSQKSRLRPSDHLGGRTPTSLPPYTSVNVHEPCVGPWAT